MKFADESPCFVFKPRRRSERREPNVPRQVPLARINFDWLSGFPSSIKVPVTPFLKHPRSPLLCHSDPSDQLRLDGARAERQQPLRLLLPRGTARLLPGPGHDGHRHRHGVELRVNAGLGGQLRGERRGGLHPDLQRNR